MDNLMKDWNELGDTYKGHEQLIIKIGFFCFSGDLFIYDDGNKVVRTMVIVV